MLVVASLTIDSSKGIKRKFKRGFEKVSKKAMTNRKVVKVKKDNTKFDNPSYQCEMKGH